MWRQTALQRDNLRRLESMTSSFQTSRNLCDSKNSRCRVAKEERIKNVSHYVFGNGSVRHWIRNLVPKPFSSLSVCQNYKFKVSKQRAIERDIVQCHATIIGFLLSRAFPCQMPIGKFYCYGEIWRWTHAGRHFFVIIRCLGDWLTFTCFWLASRAKANVTRGHLLLIPWTSWGIIIQPLIVNSFITAKLINDSIHSIQAFESESAIKAQLLFMSHSRRASMISTNSIFVSK